MATSEHQHDWWLIGTQADRTGVTLQCQTCGLKVNPDALLAEVERLRARVLDIMRLSLSAFTQLQSAIAERDEIVRAVANARGGGTSGLYLSPPEGVDGAIDADYAQHLHEKARRILEQEQREW